MELCYNLTMKARPCNDDSISLTTLFFYYAILHNGAKVILESQILFVCISFKSPASKKEKVRFPDSPDFEKFPDFRTGRDVR